MTKHTINKGYENEKTIESEGYMQSGGYWHFLDARHSSATTVYSVKVEEVMSIEREPEAA